MKFPFFPKISPLDRHRENLISYFLAIGSPVILFFAIMEWLNNRQDEAILDIAVLVIIFVSAIIRRVDNPQLIYRIVMIAFGLNFLYTLSSNEGILPALFLPMAFLLPAVILLGIKEGIIWIIAMSLAIAYILTRPAKAPYADLETITIYLVIYLIVGLFSIFSEFVRRETARMLADRQTDLETLNQTIMEKALEDPLTHTFNRGYLLDIMTNKVSLSVTLDKPLSIIIVDIDQFKEINDTYGHNIGDKVLVEIASLFKHQLRGASDDLVRLGGDEFMIVLPDTKLEHAVSLADRLRRAVETMEILNEPIEVTCSMGVVQLEKIENRRTFLPDQAIRTLIKRGDDCMYMAKRRGKNQVFSSDADLED
jgi:diguanylate cyclase (GGDEF)-like protein